GRPTPAAWTNSPGGPAPPSPRTARAVPCPYDRRPRPGGTSYAADALVPRNEEPSDGEHQGADGTDDAAALVGPPVRPPLRHPVHAAFRGLAARVRAPDARRPPLGADLQDADQCVPLRRPLRLRAHLRLRHLLAEERPGGRRLPHPHGRPRRAAGRSR